MLAHKIFTKVLSLIFLGCFSALAQAATQHRSISIEDFHSQLQVENSGAVEVQEKIRYRFEGSWNGIIRNISLKKRSIANGSISNEQSKLRISVSKIEDENGKSLEYWKSEDNAGLSLKIKIPGAANAAKTVVISYRIQNAVHFLEEMDLIRLNLTGNSSDIPIEHCSADVILPPEIPKDSVQSKIYTGLLGDQGSGWTEESKNNASLHFEAAEKLGPREGMTIELSIPKNYLAPPAQITPITPPPKTQYVYGSYYREDRWPLLLPIAGLLLQFLIFLYLCFKKAPKPPTSSSEPTPPPGLSPAEMGVLADNKLHRRDIAAAVVDLATRGFVVIEEVNEKELESGQQRDFVLKPGEKAFTDSTLLPFEKKLLVAIFRYGKNSEVRLSALRYAFFSQIPQIRSQILDSLVAKGYYRNHPDRALHSGLILPALIFGSLTLWGIFIPVLPVYWAVLVICAVFSFLLARYSPRRTEKGLIALRQTRQFENSIQQIDPENPKNLAAGNYEKYLPHAISLGLQSHWTKSYRNPSMPPPLWYSGISSPFYWGNLFMFEQAIRQHMFSAPRSFYSHERQKSWFGADDTPGAWDGIQHNGLLDSGSSFFDGGSSFSSGGDMGGGFSGGGDSGGGSSGW